MAKTFCGRSLSVVNDFTADEQFYLYMETAKLKAAVQSGSDLARWKITDPNKAVYLIFMEDSTRTKESFRNAALFHGCKMNVFDAASSSFNKKESITDTVKMLCGYSTSQSLFVIRSKLEGTCTWLDKVVGEYCGKLDVPRASFLNAGDGRHEHPTQEFLDEFSFLEQMKWDRREIHLCLVGDLYHGRTVHSKADGLGVFKKVKVDLIAPPELAMPAEYVDRMVKNGFEVTTYGSIDQYLVTAKKHASIWYFTRLQLERMGEKVLGRETLMRQAVTIRREHLEKIPQDSKFYHPLPRHQKHPVLPVYLDNTSFNAYDGQSVNGYYTRIMELALLGGAEVAAFEPPSAPVPQPKAEFVEELVMAVADDKQKPTPTAAGIRPIAQGVVLDHICVGTDVARCWKRIRQLVRILGVDDEELSVGVFDSTTQKGCIKGIIFVPNHTEEFSIATLKKLAAISPETTLNVVKDNRVVKKFRLHMPPRIYDFDEIDCTNAACISHKKNHEHAMMDFVCLTRDPPVFKCVYCEKPHKFNEVWAL